MNLDQLKSQHAELYAAVLAEGATGERKRVNSLLRLGKKFHAEAIAQKAIEDGTPATDEALQVEFLDRFANWRNQDLHQQDSDAASAVIANVRRVASSTGRDAGDRMADAIGLPPDPGPRRQL